MYDILNMWELIFEMVGSLEEYVICCALVGWMSAVRLQAFERKGLNRVRCRSAALKVHECQHYCWSTPKTQTF
jgi:hypothetical protein